MKIKKENMEIDKFENFTNEKKTAQEVFDLLKSKFDENTIIEMFDEEVDSGNWIEDDWEDEYESKYDWYIDYNNNEAEDAVAHEILNTLNVNFSDFKDGEYDEFIVLLSDYSGISFN